MMHGQKNIKL